MQIKILFALTYSTVFGHSILSLVALKCEAVVTFEQAGLE